MRKVYSFVVALGLLLTFTYTVQAQDRSVKFTLGAGLAMPSVTGSSGSVSATVSLTESPYVYAGVDYALPSNPLVHLEGGLQWSLLGQKELSSNESLFSLPLSVRYQFSESLPLSLGAGFYAGKVFVDGVDVDFGLLLKARYDFDKRFFAQVQYNLGLTNHSALLGTSAKLNTLQIGIGMTF